MLVDALMLCRLQRLNAGDPGSSYSNQVRVQTDGAVFVVHRQPIALDRFTIHEVHQSDSSSKSSTSTIINSVRVCECDEQIELVDDSDAAIAGGTAIVNRTQRDIGGYRLC